MASFGKMALYDWAGANEWLFSKINGAINSIGYNDTMVLISRATNSKNFPIYLSLLCLCALLDFTLRKINARGGANHSIAAWFGVVAVAGCAFIIDGSVVGMAKKEFAYPRPYVTMAPEDMTLLEYNIDRDDDYRSFPSGHVSMVTVLVVALWPAVSAGIRQLALSGLMMTSWSRIAMGVHFPADVFYAIFLALIITVMVRWILYPLFLRLNIKC